MTGESDERAGVSVQAVDQPEPSINGLTISAVNLQRLTAQLAKQAVEGPNAEISARLADRLREGLRLHVWGEEADALRNAASVLSLDRELLRRLGEQAPGGL